MFISKLHRDFVAVLEYKYSFECAEELWDGFLPKIQRQSALESRNSPGIKTLLDTQIVELDGIFGDGEIKLSLVFNMVHVLYIHCRFGS